MVRRSIVGDESKWTSIPLPFQWKLDAERTSGLTVNIDDEDAFQVALEKEAKVFQGCKSKQHVFH